MGLKHQAVIARKWRAAIREVEQHFPAHLPPLLFLTDPTRIADPIASTHDLPVGAGVVFRHFGAADRVQTAETLAKLCTQQNRPLLIAADPILARQVGATGVHWPEALVTEARQWRDRFALQTASAHSRSALVRAAKVGMDAALLSTVFQSASSSAGPPMGPVRLRRLCQSTPLPIYALGGINESTARRISSHAGLSGVALYKPR